MQDFVPHVKARFSAEGTIFEATLVSIGSGKIQANDENSAIIGVFQGTGDDINYTYEDQTAGHGPLLYSLEWVD